MEWYRVVKLMFAFCDERFEVLMSVSIKVMVLWGVMLCCVSAFSRNLLPPFLPIIWKQQIPPIDITFLNTVILISDIINIYQDMPYLSKYKTFFSHHFIIFKMRGLPFNQK
jgi:hypothetical protein